MWLVAVLLGVALGLLGAPGRAGPGPGTTPTGASASTQAAPPGEPSAAEREAKLAEAKRLFLQGNELRVAGDCQRALELYLKSRALVASVANTWNAAVCLDTLGRLDEALGMYETLLTELAGELSRQDLATVRQSAADLRERVGGVDVLANVGGSLVIDGRMRGALPLSAPVRVLPGEHVVQVMKEGYATFEAKVDVRVGKTVAVAARLEPLAIAGRLRVDLPELAGAEVSVDGAVLGTTPWEGALEPGEHVLAVWRGDVGSAPTPVVVVKGQTVLARIPFGPLGSETRLDVDPPTAELYLDDVRIARGRWRGRLPVGQHHIEAREEGYFTESRVLDVSPEKGNDTKITLRVDEDHPRWGAGESGHLWIDLFGGAALAPTLASGAEQDCSAGRCTGNPWAAGFLVGARGGYEFPPRVSIEIGAGYLSLAKTVSRQVDESFRPSGAAGDVATAYLLSDELRFSGPFAGAGLGYRLPLGDIVELRTHLLVGAFFAFARDQVGGTVSSQGRTLPVDVQGAGTVVQAADLFIMPELHLGLRFGGFAVSLGLDAALFAIPGPALPTGDVRPSGGTCTAAEPAAVDCAPGETFAAGARSYGTLLVLLPSAALGYAF